MKKFALVLSFLFATVFYAQQPYVLLVSYDAFRWDYLDRGITPNMEKFAEEGVRALSLEPVFPSKTFPNHLSIITGLYAENHGIISNDFINTVTLEHYKITNAKEVRNRKWYLGEPFWVTAKRNGIKTASFFWPSSTVTDSSYSPDIYKLFNDSIKFEARVDSVVSWLQLPYEKRPHFITLYFCLTDTYGHRFGPNSDSINFAISRMDEITKYMEDKLRKANMYDSVNIIILSDHGMTEIYKDKIINIEKILTGYDVQYSNAGPLMMIKPKKEETEKVYSILKENENHFKVYKRAEVPEYYHFSKNPFIYPLVLIADLGWSLVNERSKTIFLSDTVDNKGNHGYDNHILDMHGFFIARGPAFKKGYKTGTLLNIDIYPLLCEIFNIFPVSKIDGEAERIEFILK
jgi:predicted AlkP superfamily pyrophosphatase or phosphodiesterase